MNCKITIQILTTIVEMRHSHPFVYNCLLYNKLYFIDCLPVIPLSSSFLSDNELCKTTQILSFEQVTV